MSVTVTDVKNFADIAVALTIMAGALAAAFKYQTFKLFLHRWESDLSCKDRLLASGEVLFVAEYTVQNRGQRPLRLRTATLKLVPCVRRVNDALLYPDLAHPLASRQVPDSVGNPGNLDVQPGERSIFTLRCILPSLPELVFVQCLLELPYSRRPALFVGLHVRQSRGTRLPATPSELIQGLITSAPTNSAAASSEAAVRT